jgi:hypothetical protein
MEFVTDFDVAQSLYQRVGRVDDSIEALALAVSQQRVIPSCGSSHQGLLIIAGATDAAAAFLSDDWH